MFKMINTTKHLGIQMSSNDPGFFHTIWFTTGLINTLTHSFDSFSENLQ